MLEVQITRTVSWTEEIPFSTKQTQSSEYAFGTTRTVQEGENGVRTITAQNLYDTDGNLLNQTILSSEITKEPVDREIVVGHQAAQRQRGPGGQRHLHLAGAPSIPTARAGIPAATRAWTSAPPPAPPSMRRPAAWCPRPGYERAGAGSCPALTANLPHHQPRQRLPAPCTPTACP